MVTRNKKRQESVAKLCARLKFPLTFHGNEGMEISFNNAGVFGLAEVIADLAKDCDRMQDRIEDLIAENTALRMKLAHMPVTTEGNHVR